MSSKNKSEKRINKENRKNIIQSYFNRYSGTISSLINDEKSKNQEEKSKDFKALILTIIIVAIIVFIFWKVPFLNNLIF